MINIHQELEKFRTVVYNRYQVYNGLFLNLAQGQNLAPGIYIPLLFKLCDEGYKKAKDPKSIIDEFFQKHTDIEDADKRFDLLFQMVKYIERQVVLFDCIEDAAFIQFRKDKISNHIVPGNPDYEEYCAFLDTLNVRVVFTAHPTQFYSDKVQLIMGRLRDAVKKDEVSEIDMILRQLSYTPFVNSNKPTPLQEAQNIIFYLRNVYYHTLGRLYQNVCNLSGKPLHFNPRLIEMGFWPGGDRDGNPFVTANTTLDVANLLRNTVMKCYYHQVKDLTRKLTFKEVIADISELKERLYNQIFSFDRLITSDEILSTMYQIRAQVKEKYEGLYLEEIDNFIGKLYLFADHFAALDIRQDSSAHHEVIQDIFHNKWQLDYNNLSDAEKLSYLTGRFENLSAEDFDNELTKDTIRNVQQVREIQSKNGERGMHRYIISNTEDIFGVLEVFALFKWCGYREGEINMDIVPLFETMKGMADAESVMRALYENKIYRSHLTKRNNSQTIMLGFSDGTKDGGYLKANWEIYKTKQILTRISAAYGIKVTFFDGRGGPPARGGGKTHQFYASQGSEISNDNIHLTIQGQTITSVYGTMDHANYNLEQLILAATPPKRKSNNISDDQKEILSELAELSFAKYTELKSHPQFIPYLEQITTLRYYGETNIASRPTKRNTDKKLSLRDLRAIPFVGAWSLIRQNVPGYYGLGSALEKYNNQPEVLKNLYQECAFFRTLINNSIMSMQKSFFPLTAYLKDHPEFGLFWQNLKNEYDLTKKWLLYLSDQQELMDNESLAKASNLMRERIVLPLITIQQYALQSLQNENVSKREILEKLIIRCLFGNINASRNSA